MKKIVLLLYLLIFAVLLFSVQVTAEEQEDKYKKVLVVHSYDPGYEWTSTISRGIKRVFESKRDILVETFYMDTKKAASNEQKVRAGNDVKKIISQWNPDVVITVDDDAQEYVGKFYAGKQRPKIVFCGVSFSIGKYGYPASNVTGILEMSTLETAIAFMDKMISPVKYVSVISNDTRISREAKASIGQEIIALGKKVASYDCVETFSDWKSKILSYQSNNTDIILTILYDFIKNDSTGNILPPEEIMKWTVDNINIPVIGLSPDIVDNGALLGAMTSGLEQGRESALITLGLLNGRDIKEFPVKSSKSSVILLNKNTAKKLGIPMSDELLKNVDVIVGE